MRRPFLLLILILPTLFLLSNACGSSGGSYNEVPAIIEVTHSPAVVHAGDMVLISYLIGSDTVWDNGDFRPLLGTPDVLNVSAGAITPLAASVYTPGAPLPDFATALSAFEGYSGSDDPASNVSYSFQQPFYYMLYQAPDTPQTVEIEFHLGGGGGPESPRARHTLELEVN
ncbi:MAG: hypothetical protein H7A35_07390 [Planctomycetales bacterium]|nr:hypothetical protein [bacterium]UNM09874.1 MAG: hypothetical protein H7A35_07390 [Planctomycetales bacterium]